MVKIATLLLIFQITLLSGNYENNCVSCHKDLAVGIDKFFYRYLLVFSSEVSVKAALKDYLQHPMKEKSLLPEGLIKRFGIKSTSNLSEKELDEAINKYWETYKVIGKLQ